MARQNTIHDEGTLKAISAQLRLFADQIDAISKRMKSDGVKRLSLAHQQGVVNGLTSLQLMISEATGKLDAEKLRKDLGG